MAVAAILMVCLFCALAGLCLCLMFRCVKVRNFERAERYGLFVAEFLGLAMALTLCLHIYVESAS